jgi:hypothetical protein
MAATATQMNVRIPAEVKAAGDKALLSEGLTPTEVVRCVWEKAARRGRDLQQVVDLVRAPAKTRLSTNTFESAALAVSSQMLTLGVDLSTEDSAQLSDEELLEMAYYEKAGERGLL